MPCASASAPVWTRRHHAAFEARFGFPWLQAWAMTETGAGAVVIANREPRQVGTACFGRAEPAVAWRLVDEGGQDVPVGTPGELLVRAAGASPRFGFFREYLKDREATDEAWQGGWFHTGDLVRADEQGCLYFIDRRKNVIRRSGENISAVEVESVLRRHPRVAEVAVAATPDPVRGDEVLACVIVRDPVPQAELGARAGRLDRGPGAGTARLLQGARVCGFRRRAAAHGHPEGAARRVEGAGPGAAGAARLHRYPRTEAPAGRPVNVPRDQRRRSCR